MPATTTVPELNDILERLTRGVEEILGENFIGAYLQGSFALGDHDESSDVDFIIAIRHDLNTAMLPRLQTLHERIFDMPSYWAKHLEGSYVPIDIWRRWTTVPRDPPGEPRDDTWTDPGMDGTSANVYPFYYLNNGARSLVRSEHDNSQVVRWVMRERGITIAGPDPAEIMDPVSSEQLISEVAHNLPVYAAPYIADPSRLDRRWLAAFFVVLYCRMLHTIETGEVHSKKAGVDWATSTLAPEWIDLINNAWDIRGDNQETLTQSPSSEEIGRTTDFLTHAINTVSVK